MALNTTIIIPEYLHQPNGGDAKEEACNFIVGNENKHN